MRITFLSILLLVIVPLAVIAQSSDIDGDGLLDTEEDQNGDGIVNSGETDPMNADTDGGGEADGLELQEGRDPLDRTDDYTYDLDNDGLSNGRELQQGTDPADPDTDGDGINDRDDPFPLESKYKQDSDNDGLPDSYEIEQNLQRDTRSDAEEDQDNDGLTNLEEFIQGTEIDNPDTDQDGVLDGREVTDGTDPLENPCLFHAGPTEVLHDIEGHWSKPFVIALSETKVEEHGRRIVQGYWTDDGAMFAPDQEISRFELLKIALMSSCIPITESVDDGTFSFPDVTRVSRPRESSDTALKRRTIYTAYERGIVEGYADGMFQPDEPVNRAEAVKMLLLSSSLEPFDDENYLETFTDVTEDDWFSSHVNTALSYEFVEGYGDTTFRPGQSITRAEAAKIVLFMMISNPRVNGYVVPVEDLNL